jgi:hypothetical protein
MTADENPSMRHLFHETPATSIDLSAVTRRSRARRLPKVLGIGAAGIIAVGGFGVFGLQAVAGYDPGLATAALDSAADDAPVAGAAAPESQANEFSANSDEGKRRAATNLNQCGAAPIVAAPSARGLGLTMQIPDAVAASERIASTVTLFNSGDSAVVAYTAPYPTITVSRSGIVVWQGTAELDSADIEFTLAPGESRSYHVDFAPGQCTASDDTTSGGAPLAALPSGTYQVSAALDVWGAGDAELVMSATENLRLR